LRCEVWERRSCRACRAAAHWEPSSERALKAHSACSEAFACERFKLGRNSPGPVADAEYVHLLITDPQALDPRSGKILPVILKQIDAKGVSVLRERASNQEFRLTFVEMRRGSDAKGQPRYFHGVCRFLTGSIRARGGTDRIGIYDTALPGRRHHADVLAPPLGTRRDREARTKRLIDLIGPSFIGVAKFRDGAFIADARLPAP
jgi:hypothetical protein